MVELWTSLALDATGDFWWLLAQSKLDLLGLVQPWTVDANMAVNKLRFILCMTNLPYRKKNISIPNLLIPHDEQHFMQTLFINGSKIRLSKIKL